MWDFQSGPVDGNAVYQALPGSGMFQNSSFCSMFFRAEPHGRGVSVSFTSALIRNRERDASPN